VFHGVVCYLNQLQLISLIGLNPNHGELHNDIEQVFLTHASAIKQCNPGARFTKHLRTILGKSYELRRT